MKCLNVALNSRSVESIFENSFEGYKLRRKLLHSMYPSDIRSMYRISDLRPRDLDTFSPETRIRKNPLAKDGFILSQF